MTYMQKPARHARRRGIGDVFDDLGIRVSSGFDEPDPNDHVNETASGGTTTTAADFSIQAGICKPANFPALNAVRELQRQLNRVAQVKGLAKTTADGAVGPATLALFRQVQSSSAGAVMGDPSTCMGVAPDVDVLGAQVRAMADTLGAPATVSGPLALVTPTIVTKSGKTLVAPDAGLLGSLGALSTVEKIALLGVAGGIGYLLMNRRKGRKR